MYRHLAQRSTGEERDILLAIAEAERRHEQHWLNSARGPSRQAATCRSADPMLGFLARHFGPVIVLPLAQRADSRSTYDTDVDATAAMAADERIHLEVVRALATRGRDRLSGTFRAAVFGANDGLVSNLALVLGVGATGVGAHTVLVTGLAGLLAGALSMGAGEYVSVTSQRELLEASTPSPEAGTALPQLDVDANELALVYRARGIKLTRRPAMPPTCCATSTRLHAGQAGRTRRRPARSVGTGVGAGVSSFCFFASGALIPVLPYLFGLQGVAAVVVAAGWSESPCSQRGSSWACSRRSAGASGAATSC